MATSTSASEPPSGEETINVPRSDYFIGVIPKCFDTSLNFFLINFCNIRGLRYSFQSVEHHLSSTKPHLLLTETQVSEATDSIPFSVPFYFLYSRFCSKESSKAEVLLAFCLCQLGGPQKQMARNTAMEDSTHRQTRRTGTDTTP
ncbi:hypothetical protein E2C01_030849 [Portunus trituberculatus]|uniref:Uncharacterized protein n=1 Tax=Portunus trituberculatus TaxID=210409 RepID=A0A5B7EVB0_PORTR|nr:hypothetical protein [Portunus trituberculatus]